MLTFQSKPTFSSWRGRCSICSLNLGQVKNLIQYSKLGPSPLIQTHAHTHTDIYSDSSFSFSGKINSDTPGVRNLYFGFIMSTSNLGSQKPMHRNPYIVFHSIFIPLLLLWRNNFRFMVKRTSKMNSAILDRVIRTNESFKIIFKYLSKINETPKQKKLKKKLIHTSCMQRGRQENEKNSH